MTKDSIALIGFMATGKTLIGKELVKQLGNDYQFIETDQMVVKMAGKSIIKIFKEEGEPIFRRYEKDACKKVSNLRKAVVSCGGGVVLNETNIRNLRKNYHIVLLTATTDEIYNRIMMNGKKKRPLVDKENPKKEIENILQYREPLYRSVADITIDTVNKEISEIVHEIIIKTKINK
ncbi:MAG: shikimate kinase [Promethearchaeota archaeon]